MRKLIASLALVAVLGPALPAVAGEPININSASAEDLVALNGVGEVIAKRILDYRKANDGFDSVDELKSVEGIGPKTLESLRGKVTVGD